jgi:hypothetical protein
LIRCRLFRLYHCVSFVVSHVQERLADPEPFPPNASVARPPVLSSKREETCTKPPGIRSDGSDSFRV